MEAFKRQTAYKFWIKDLNSATPTVDEKGMNCFNIKNTKVMRVNILANIINKYESENKNYTAITLDDSSDQIRLKVWNEDTKLLENVNIGNTILVIGKLTKSNNNEIYIRPEIVKEIKNLVWEKVRKLELTKKYGTPTIEPTKETAPEEEKPEEPTTTPEEIKEVVEEEIIQEDEEPVKPSIAAREKILRIIEKNITEEGMETSKIIKESGLTEEEAENIIRELLMEGEIYETKPGKIKLT